MLRIKRDFINGASDEIISQLEQLSTVEPEIFSTPRILRCIIAASKGNRSEIENSIELARIDYRDLILNAEYKYNKVDGSHTHLIDLNKPFSD